MSIQRIGQHLRAFWRAEATIADIQTRRMAVRAGLVSFACLLGVFGIVALSVATFYALEPLWGPAWAAAAIGGFHIYLSSLAAMMASRTRSTRDLELATEYRQQALSHLEDDAQAVSQTIEHPLKLLPALAVPIIAFALRMANKPSAAAAKKSS